MLTLINLEKLIVRDELGDVVERVLAFRARLLAFVAQRVSSGDELQRAVSLASLEIKSDSGPTPAPDGRLGNPQHFYNYALATLAIKFGIEDSLPSAQVQPTTGHGKGGLMMKQK
jgi:hypothetical protein